jgi:hypothetical protein
MKKETYSPEEIEKRFESLPADIKALVYSAEMLNAIQNVGTKHQLHVDQVGTLESEVADVMTGFSLPEEFVPNLKESLGLDDTKTQAIAKDINDQLFIKIRESMKKASEQSSVPRQAVPQPSAPSMPPSAAPKTVVPPPVPSTPAAVPPVAPPTMPQTPKKPDLSPVDSMLERKNVTVPPPSATPATATPPPGVPLAKPYATDPYREPPTP